MRFKDMTTTTGYVCFIQGCKCHQGIMYYWTNFYLTTFRPTKTWTGTLISISFNKMYQSNSGKKTNKQ